MAHTDTDKSPMLHFCKKRKAQQEIQSLKKIGARIFLLLVLFHIPSLAHTTRRSISLYVPTPDSPLPLAPSHHRLHETTTTILSCFYFAIVRSPFLTLYLHSPRGVHCCCAATLCVYVCTRLSTRFLAIPFFFSTVCTHAFCATIGK